MKKELLWVGIVFFSLGMLMSGMQTITGYYADPSGYGFQHQSLAYLNISLAITVLAGMLVISVMKRLGRHI